MKTNPLLRRVWNRSGFSLFGLGIVFAVVLASFRALGMLGGGGWQLLLPLGFVIMAAIPFIFLTREGRTAVGFRKSRKVSFYLAAIAMGGAAALVVYTLGILLFGNSDDNWYVTIRNSYLYNPGYRPDATLFSQFLFFTIPALIFSPVGEEIFFRGFLQQALSERMGVVRASIADAAFFGIVHLVHHGIVNRDGHLVVYPVSGFVWVLLMAATAWMLGWVRMRSQSLYPAMLAHACFNGTMNYLIFYHL